MPILRERRWVKSAAVLALIGVGLMGVSFTHLPLLSGAAGIVGCLIAVPATLYVLYDGWIGLNQ